VLWLYNQPTLILNMKDPIESIKTSLSSAVSDSASKFIKKSKSIKDKVTLIATTGFGAIDAN